jgi:hypothetical protein
MYIIYNSVHPVFEYVRWWCFDCSSHGRHAHTISLTTMIIQYMYPLIAGPPKKDDQQEPQSVKEPPKKRRRGRAETTDNDCEPGPSKGKKSKI